MIRVDFARPRESGLVWDLAYNGILYSVLRGHARTNKRLRKRFPFP